MNDNTSQLWKLPREIRNKEKRTIERLEKLIRIQQDELTRAEYKVIEARIALTASQNELAKIKARILIDL